MGRSLSAGCSGWPTHRPPCISSRARLSWCRSRTGPSTAVSRSLRVRSQPSRSSQATRSPCQATNRVAANGELIAGSACWPAAGGSSAWPLPVRIRFLHGGVSLWLDPEENLLALHSSCSSHLAAHARFHHGVPLTPELSHRPRSRAAWDAQCGGRATAPAAPPGTAGRPAYWFPLALFGAVIALSVPLYAYGMSPPPRRSPGGSVTRRCPGRSPRHPRQAAATPARSPLRSSRAPACRGSRRDGTGRLCWPPDSRRPGRRTGGSAAGAARPGPAGASWPRGCADRGSHRRAAAGDAAGLIARMAVAVRPVGQRHVRPPGHRRRPGDAGASGPQPPAGDHRPGLHRAALAPDGPTLRSAPSALTASGGDPLRTLVSIGSQAQPAEAALLPALVLLVAAVMAVALPSRLSHQPRAGLTRAGGGGRQAPWQRTLSSRSGR